MSWSSECNWRTWVTARVSYLCLKMIVRWNKERQFHTSDGISFETRDCQIGCAWVHSGEPYSWSRAHVTGPSLSITTSVNLQNGWQRTAMLVHCVIYVWSPNARPGNTPDFCMFSKHPRLLYVFWYYIVTCCNMELNGSVEFLGGRLCVCVEHLTRCKTSISLYCQ